MMNQTLNLLSRHRSIRNFSDRPVSDETITTLVKAAQHASTSHHVQAYTIIQVKNPDTRQTIATLAGPQPWVAKAPVFLVFCADITRLAQAAQSLGVQPETGWAEQLIVTTVDTALLAQNLMIGAESIGLGGVFIGGIRNDPEKVSDLLKIPNHAFPVFGMCLGYPGHDPDVKPRFPVDMILKEETFYGPSGKPDKDQEKQDIALFDKILNTYYQSRNTNIKDQTWTRQLGEFTGKIIRPEMKSFLKKKGFFLK